MKELDTLADRARAATQVFLPNRYSEPFVDAYQDLTDIEVPVVGDRKIVARSDGRTFRWIRGREIPEAVSLMSGGGSRDDIIGLTGSEWVEEYCAGRPRSAITCERAGERRLGRVSLIAERTTDVPALRTQLFGGREPVRVVTAYPNLVRLLGRVGRPAMSITAAQGVSGGVEAWANALGIPGVDLVSSGDTIRANGFVEVEAFGESYPELLWASEDVRRQREDIAMLSTVGH